MFVVYRAETAFATLTPSPGLAHDANVLEQEGSTEKCHEGMYITPVCLDLHENEYQDHACVNHGPTHEHAQQSLPTHEQLAHVSAWHRVFSDRASGMMREDQWVLCAHDLSKAQCKGNGVDRFYREQT